MKEVNFEKSLVAFIDILGFKELIKENKELLTDVLNLLYQIKEKTRNFTGEIKPEGTGVFNIKIGPNLISHSDHIIISYPLDELKNKYPTGTDEKFVLFNALNDLANYINYFHIEALKIGLHFRGAIAHGDLYFDREQNIIIGEPLIEAIEDESKLANYPRVICSKSLLEQKKIRGHGTALSTVFKKDFDGIYFADYFGFSFTYFIGMNQIFALEEIRKRIEISISTQIDKDGKLSILSKLYWLANYFDVTLKYWKNNKKELEYWNKHYPNIREEIDTIPSFNFY